MKSPGSVSACFVVMAALIYAPSAPSQTASDDGLPKRLVGDYGYWSRTQTPTYSADQIPFKKLTHINHAGVSFNADGSLSVPDGFLEPELIKKAHAAGVKAFHTVVRDGLADKGTDLLLGILALLAGVRGRK